MGFGCRLVLAQALIDHLAQKVVAGPGEIFDFGDELGAHPLHAAQDQRRFESGCCAAAAPLRGVGGSDAAGPLGNSARHSTVVGVF